MNFIISFITCVFAVPAFGADDISYILVNPDVQLSQGQTKVNNTDNYFDLLKFDEVDNSSGSRKVTAKSDILWSKDKSYQMYVRRYQGSNGKQTILEANKKVKNDNFVDGHDEVRASQFENSKLQSHTVCDVKHDVRGSDSKKRVFDLMDCVTVTPELCKKIGDVNDLINQAKSCAAFEAKLAGAVGKDLMANVKKHADHNINQELKGFALNFHRGDRTTPKEKGTDNAPGLDAVVESAGKNFNGVLRAAVVCSRFKPGQNVQAAVGGDFGGKPKTPSASPARTGNSEREFTF